MKLWLKILAGALPACSLLLLSLLLLRRRLRRISPQTPPPPLPPTRFESGITKLRLSYKSAGSARNSLRFHHLHQHHNHQSPPSSPSFRWESHPRLISEAMEAGWPRFAFAFSSSSPSPSPPPFSSSSSDLMQTVRLKKTADDLPLACVSASLPLPGPAPAFPQEAYFEITILYLQPRKKPQEPAKSSDRSKLIRGNSIGVMFAPKEPAEKPRSADLVLSLGLIDTASLSNHSMPGTSAGSIGFRSDGSVYLDGRKLVFESEKAEWGDVNRVIGCGFAPRRKKVFFTVDSQLAHVIRCSSEAYSSPLYPVLAADADAMILVNLGQVPFKYAPANATRTQNPCFVRLPSGSVEAERGEHGKRSRLQNSHYSSSSKKSSGNLDDGLEGESDLFEISLQR